MSRYSLSRTSLSDVEEASASADIAVGDGSANPSVSAGVCPAGAIAGGEGSTAPPVPQARLAIEMAAVKNTLSVVRDVILGVIILFTSYRLTFAWRMCAARIIAHRPSLAMASHERVPA